MNQDEQVLHFAKTNFRNQAKVFGIKAKDRKAHMYAIGKTGTGKSTLLLNMMISDIRLGNGIALIDPHGDLAERVLEFIPKERMDDVIYFNPADTNNPIAFNPLENSRKDFGYLVASGLMSIFKKIWHAYWGPRMEHILRNSLLTLLEYPGATLMDIPRLLLDKEFRKKVVAKVTNPQVKEFWLYEFAKYSPLSNQPPSLQF